MLTADGPKVIEFNVRLGDPEAQVMLPLIDEPLLPLLVAGAAGRLRRRPAGCRRDAGRRRAGVARLSGVVGVGPPIRGRRRGANSGCLCLPRRHGARDGRLVTAGGRVLTVVGRGADFSEAIRTAYAGVPGFRSTGCSIAARHRAEKALQQRRRREVFRRHLRLPRQPGRLARLRGGASRVGGAAPRRPRRPTSSSSTPAR